MSLARKTLYRTALVWILVTIGGILASAPIAWRTLMEGAEPTRNEFIVMAWTALMTILSLPAGIILAYIRCETRHERGVSKWTLTETEDTPSP